ncbi:alcohol dehydrogenase [Colletotrichum musicola]|uniref:Alcohol dehydrogenase n=1 Tax=Colletotrichum musicola TaxID=2175873 RepID=A0A8H6KGG0_9PEZI|nr:alcohol dehydrogenase [Colletotrichum musicola]
MTSQKRIFITGASGQLGSVITELALAEGHAVHALSRSPSSDSKLRTLGAVPVRGDLASLDVLRIQSAAADAVIHLATAYVFGAGQPYESVRHLDTAAADAIADGLAGSGKPLVVTSGTLSADPDPEGGETTEASPATVNPLNTRLLTERHSLGLAARGIRVSAVRLAPYVYGRGASGVAQFMNGAARTGGVAVVAGGGNRISAVHVDDVARLYLLAAEKGRAGEIYNASSSTDVTSREVLEAIAEAVGVPVVDLSKEDAEARMGPMVAFFLSVENRASGAKAREELGWQPRGLGILEEIREGSYQAVAGALRK